MRTKLIKSELAKLLNITKSVIRYYEEKDVLSVSKDKNGYNLYDWEDLEIINNILFLKELGVSIEDRIDNILSMDNREKIISRTVEIKQIQERKFLTFKKSNYNSLKEFYNNVHDLYSKISSSNQSFILLHENYDSTKSSFENSKMLIPYINDVTEKNLYEVILPSCKYLTIKYIYVDLESFKIAYKKILDFANENNIKIDKNSFIEIEHKDYSILYKEKMYELQFQIQD